MARNLSTNHTPAFGGKSLEHDGMLIKSESPLGELTVLILKQCGEWLERDNGRKPSDQSEVSIWWKITGA